MIEVRLGEGRTTTYSPDGRLAPESYDLSRLQLNQLTLVEKAVTDYSGTVTFYAPRNPQHVSYSTVNFQHNYATDTPHIEVPCTTFAELLTGIAPEQPQLVKLDIEGSEIAVIPQILGQPVLPPQLCIEFDELGVPSERSAANFAKTHSLLCQAGYRVAHFDGVSNFLYAQGHLY